MKKVILLCLAGVAGVGAAGCGCSDPAAAAEQVDAFTPQCCSSCVATHLAAAAAATARCHADLDRVIEERDDALTAAASLKDQRDAAARRVRHERMLFSVATVIAAGIGAAAGRGSRESERSPLGYSLRWDFTRRV